MNVDFGLDNDTAAGGGNVFIPLTSGVLYVGTSWGVDRNGVSLAPSPQTDAARAVIK